MFRSLAAGLVLVASVQAVPYQIVYQSPNSVDGAGGGQIAGEEAIAVGSGDVVALDEQGVATNKTNGAYGLVQQVAARGEKVAFATAADVFAPSGLAWTNVTSGTVVNPVIRPDGVNASGELAFIRQTGPELYHWDGASLNLVPTIGGAVFALEASILDDGRIGAAVYDGVTRDYYLDGVNLTSDPIHDGYLVNGARINQSGQAVFASEGFGDTQLFFWDGSVLRHLSAELGIGDITEVEINDAGHVLFVSTTAGHNLYFWDGTEATLIGGSGGTGLNALSLGEDDSIFFSTEQPDVFVLAGEPVVESLGFSSFAGGNTAWLLAQSNASVPEPSGAVLSLLGLLAMVRRARKR